MATARGGGGGGGGRGGGAGCQVEGSNLPFETTWQQLKDHFKQAGAVLRADIPSKGSGVVSFASTREAAKAIQLFNDSTFGERRIEVLPSFG